MTTSSGKHPEDFNHAHFAYVLYKLKATVKVTNDLSSGFDHDRGKRQQELTYNKNNKRKHHVRFMLRHVFISTQPQEKATYGLG